MIGSCCQAFSFMGDKKEGVDFAPILYIYIILYTIRRFIVMCY
jgi:hypothetical protein